MHQAVEEWELRLMKNKKWYIVIKYWFDENDYHCRLNHWTVLTNDKDYYEVRGESHIEEIDPKDKLWMNNPKNKFRVERKDGCYIFTGNLEKCLDFIDRISGIEGLENWEWSNGKYDAIEIEVDEDE